MTINFFAIWSRRSRIGSSLPYCSNHTSYTVTGSGDVEPKLPVGIVSSQCRHICNGANLRSPRTRYRTSRWPQLLSKRHKLGRIVVSTHIAKYLSQKDLHLSWRVTLWMSASSTASCNQRTTRSISTSSKSMRGTHKPCLEKRCAWPRSVGYANALLPHSSVSIAASSRETILAELGFSFFAAVRIQYGREADFNTDCSAPFLLSASRTYAGMVPGDALIHSRVVRSVEMQSNRARRELRHRYLPSQHLPLICLHMAGSRIGASHCHLLVRLGIGAHEPRDALRNEPLADFSGVGNLEFFDRLDGSARRHVTGIGSGGGFNPRHTDRDSAALTN